MGADLTGINICCNNDQFLDPLALRDWAREREQIIVIDTNQVDVTMGQDGLFFWHTDTHQRVILDNSILIVSEESSSIPSESYGDSYPDIQWKPERARNRMMVETGKNWWYFNQRTIFGKMIEHIAEAWECSLEAVLDEMEVDRDRIEVQLAEEDDFINVLVEWCAYRP